MHKIPKCWKLSIKGTFFLKDQRRLDNTVYTWKTAVSSNRKNESHYKWPLLGPNWPKLKRNHKWAGTIFHWIAFIRCFYRHWSIERYIGIILIEERIYTRMLLETEQNNDQVKGHRFKVPGGVSYWQCLGKDLEKHRFSHPREGKLPECFLPWFRLNSFDQKYQESFNHTLLMLEKASNFVRTLSIRKCALSNEWSFL